MANAFNNGRFMRSGGQSGGRQPALFCRARVGSSPVCDNIYPPRRPNLTPKLKRQDAKTPSRQVFNHGWTQINTDKAKAGNPRRKKAQKSQN